MFLTKIEETNCYSSLFPIFTKLQGKKKWGKIEQNYLLQYFEPN